MRETCGDLTLGAVIFDPDQRCDELLEKIARRLRHEGSRIAAYVQRQACETDGCCALIEVEEIFTGNRWPITQALGPGSQACRVDPHGLAAVAAHALEALEQAPDLVILNRFGKCEAEGQGVRAVLERACLAGIPVLIVVKPAQLSAWQVFSGGLAQIVPAQAEAVMTWCRAAVQNAGGGPRAASFA